MKQIIIFCLAIFLATNAFASTNEESPTPVEPLKMLNSNKGLIVYSDNCSNGANSSDKKSVREFITKMEADTNSKLYKIEQRALKMRKDADASVWVADPIEAAHVRNGCGSTYNKLIATVNTRLAYNGHDVETQYIIVIKDIVEEAERRLELVDVKPFFIKADEE